MARIDQETEKPLLLDIEGSPVGPIVNEKEVLVPRWSQALSTAPTSTTASKRVSIRESLVTVQCILLNVFSTVTVVFMNKIVFSDPQLKKCQMSVAAWHFVATAVVLYLSTVVGLFPAVRAPIKTMLPISSFFAGFLILGNLSLTFNSLGFYQLAKIMTTPTVVLLNFVLFGLTITRYSLLAVLTVCCGVLLVTTTGMADNVFGTLIAVAAFTVTALYQIWIGKKMGDLKMSAPQLLLNQAPVAAVMLIVLAPFVDTIPNLAEVGNTQLYVLGGSGVLASLLNLSQFLIIERTSALAFNVISQVKTIIIVGLSWYSEGRQLTLMDVAGVTLTLGGAYAYSVLSMKKK